MRCNRIKAVAVGIAALFVMPICSVSAQPSVSAKAAILIEATTGTVLYAKNEKQHLPMASTTKIMTALLTLEHAGRHLDTPFLVDSDAIMVEGTSMGLQTGDYVNLRALTIGMLLASGNDAANAAAVRVGGSIPQFAAMMNQRAAQLGMLDTNFVTPSGLDDQTHYSCAYDMALLARQALANQTFSEICSAVSMQATFGNPATTRTYTNHNRLLREYEGAIGVKTGYTKKSGRCLVSAARRNGVALIAVTLGAPNDWSDHKAMLDYGFSVVEAISLDTDFSDHALRIVGGEQETVPIYTPQTPTAGLSTQAQAALVRTVHLKPFYHAPIASDTVVGYAQYCYDGKVIATVPLLTQQAVAQRVWPKKAGFWAWLAGVFGRKT